MSLEFDQSAVAVIHRNVQALVRLIDQLLDLTHIAKVTLRLETERVDAHEVMRFVLKNLEESAGIESSQHRPAMGSPAWPYPS